MRILGITGSVRRPSRTALVVERILERAALAYGVETRLIDLANAAPVLFKALRSDELDDVGRDIVAEVEAADILVVGSPVYRASYTGALKHLFDLVDFRALQGRKVILAATGGTPLHGLTLEHQFRPLFGFFGAVTVPTTIYATEVDFDGYELINPAVDARIERAISELLDIFPAKGISSHNNNNPSLRVVARDAVTN